MITVKTPIAIVIWLVSITCWADKVSLENDLVKNLSRSISMYRVVNAEATPTNWSQLRTQVNEQYLAIMENEFRKLGKEAGFETSIVEKYVFLPLGVKAPYRPSSQVLMMSSSPFKWPTGETGRYVIFDMEEGAEKILQNRWWKEGLIQEMIAEAGVKISEPETAPPLKLPEPVETLWQDKVYLLFKYWSGKLWGRNVSGSTTPDSAQVKWFLAGIAVILSGILAVRVIRRRRMRD